MATYAGGDVKKWLAASRDAQSVEARVKKIKTLAKGYTTKNGSAIDDLKIKKWIENEAAGKEVIEVPKEVDAAITSLINAATAAKIKSRQLMKIMRARLSKNSPEGKMQKVKNLFESLPDDIKASLLEELQM